MKWFAGLKIARKLTLVFSVLIVFTCILALFSIQQLVKVSSASSEIASTWLPAVRYLGQMQNSLTRYRISEATHIMLQAQDEMAATDQAMASRLTTLSKQQAAYVALFSAPQEQRTDAALQRLLSDYLRLSQQLTSLSHAGKKDEALSLFRGASNKLFRQVNEQLEALVKLNDAGSQLADQRAVQTFSEARRLIVLMLVLLVLLSLVLVVLLARAVTRPLQQAVELAQRVAAGDLTATIVARGGDETGQLLTALATMNASLLQVVREVRGGTDSIATAAGQIASGNMDLSHRTEAQASALEETASAMEQLASTVRQNADHARQASRLSDSASSVVSQCGKVVEDVICTMEAISASSHKIVDIISVIDSIAFQTNILALNAAVEAARAGEQGRGFAVVASEVRNLAQRSAGAAREIKTLIDNSVAQVGVGVLQVQHAGKTMSDVVDSVHGVSSIVTKITIAGEEQRVGIDEVNRAIIQMDDVTQQNAALVEQAAAAASALQEQAGSLVAVVGVFRLA